MLFFSFVLNAVIFFLLLNLGYLKRRRQDPDYPQKSISKMVLFPISLAVVFTLLMDTFRGIIFYQFVLFLVAALLLYWIFYIMAKK
jgi:hypothetical protein